MIINLWGTRRKKYDDGTYACAAQRSEKDAPFSPVHLTVIALKITYFLKYGFVNYCKTDAMFNDCQIRTRTQL